jgi:hypothetical protein
MPVAQPEVKSEVPSTVSTSALAGGTVSVFDARPFFEKALAHGVAQGMLDTTRLDAIAAEAPKGMVQIARYFGSEYLRPDLEKARERIVNLVSLHLEFQSGGDLQKAAAMLRDQTLLSLSKGGSNMLRELIAMPQSSHFGMSEHGGFTDDHISLLAQWSLRSIADYRAELIQRQQVGRVVDAARWMAGALEMDDEALQEAGHDAEAVIRTALLALSCGLREMPDWVAFEKMVVLVHKKSVTAKPVTVRLPRDLPRAFHAVVEPLRAQVTVDLPRLLDPANSLRKLLDKTPAFMGRYFWVEDALNEVDHFERTHSAAWDKATGGHGDDSSLLTLFLTLAAGAPPKTLLTEKAAAALVRKIRKTGLQPATAAQFIVDHAPEQHRTDYLDLWNAFLEEAQPVLLSDRDLAMHDALALLRRECNVG